MVIKKALITGPTGVVGTSLVDELINNNIEVFCICHKGSKRINNITKNKLVHIIECNIDELNQLPNLIKNKIDVFYHFAWFGGTYGDNRNNVINNQLNIKYTIDALTAAKELGCYVFIGAGSQSEYGNCNEIKSSKTLPNPESMYAASKLSSMYIGRLYAKQLNIRFNWCRIFSVYGLNDNDNTMLMSTIRKMLNNENCNFTKGEQLWDYIYSKDCALAFRLIAEKGKNNQIYNIASGDVRTLSSYIEELHNIINPSIKINLGAIPYYEHQSMNLSADIKPLINDCGFKANYTFKDGILDILSKL